MEKLFNFVYVTTNLINGMKYVGEYSTNDINSYESRTYLGSGRPYFKNALKFYGRNNFYREILESFPTKQEAFNAQEKYIIQFDTLKPNGYNLNPKGGNQCKNTGPWLNKNLSEKHKENISKSLIGKNTWSKGCHQSKETKNLISLSEMGKEISDQTKLLMSLASEGKPKSEDHAKKCRIARLGKTVPKIFCKYCQRDYANYMYTLYHGEKCKKKNI
jgi:group I intron endonuclease